MTMRHIGYFENAHIDDLPPEWKSPEDRDALEVFLNESWKYKSIVFDDEDDSSEQSFLHFTKNGIATTSYAGTIFFKGVRLDVFPKAFMPPAYDKNRPIDTEDCAKYTDLFIYDITTKWLKYNDKNLLRFVKYLGRESETNDLKELYITLYAYLVKSVLDKGAYYQFEQIVEDRQTIKGRIDFGDYAQSKYPGGQTNVFKCTYSSFEFDNTLNRIIKYVSGRLYNATENVKTKRMFREIQSKLSEVSDAKCTAKDCDKVHLNRFNEEYRDILSLSKMFLCGESVSYDDESDASFCFLFRMEKVYEDFICGYLKTEYKSKGLTVELQHKESVFDDITISGKTFKKEFFDMRYDMLVSSEKGAIVLDTKYKIIPTFHGKAPEEIRELISQSVSSDDVYQMLAYATKRNVKDVFLLYPQRRGEEPFFDDVYGTFKPSGCDEIKIHFVKIPFVFDNKSELDQTEKDLKKIADAIIVKYVEPETALETKAAIY